MASGGTYQSPGAMFHSSLQQGIQFERQQMDAQGDSRQMAQPPTQDWNQPTSALQGAPGMMQQNGAPGQMQSPEHGQRRQACIFLPFVIKTNYLVISSFLN